MVLSGSFLFDRDFDEPDPDEERRRRERKAHEAREREHIADAKEGHSDDRFREPIQRDFDAEMGTQERRRFGSEPIQRDFDAPDTAPSDSAGEAFDPIDAEAAAAERAESPDTGDGDAEAADGDDDTDSAGTGADDAAAAAGPPLAYSEEAYEAGVAAARQEGYQEGEAAGRKAGYDEGRAAGRQEAERATEKQIQKAEDQISKKLGQLLESQRDSLRQVPETAARVGVSVARALMPALERQHGLAEIESAVRNQIAELLDEDRLLVRVSPDMHEAAGERLETLARQAGFDGKVSVIAAEELGPSDVKLEWSDGGAERKLDRLWHEVEDIVRRSLGDGGEPEGGSADTGAARDSQAAGESGGAADADRAGTPRGEGGESAGARDKSESRERARRAREKRKERKPRRRGNDAGAAEAGADGNEG